MPIIGGHVSAAGGVSKTVERGLSIGAQSIMFFGASPRQFQVNMPDQKEVDAFKKAFAESGLHSAYLHAPYLINLGAIKPQSREMSVTLLIKHYQIASDLGADGLIFHVGSANGGSMDEALQRSIESVRRVLKAVKKSSTLLIMENAAGGGTKIGTYPKELGTILKAVKSERLKICIDTAHSFESGLLEYTPKGITAFFDSWEKAAGVGSVVVLHANDSKTAFNSKHDRHENIGKGFIGLDGFKKLSRDPRVSELPWLLEVPGFDGEGPDKKNVDILKKAVK